MHHFCRLLFALAALSLTACQSLPFVPNATPTDHPSYGLVNGPDGLYVTQQNGPWGTPNASQIYRRLAGDTALSQPPWVDLTASESDFYYSAPSQSYCFISDRDGNADIWCGQWLSGEWQEPEKLPVPVNSSAAEYSPVISAAGDIYFASDRLGGEGLGDIYRAEKTAQGWQVTSLGPKINTPGGEWNFDLSPDGNILIFEASHRETNHSVSGDLYLSRRKGNGWGLATPLHALNTDGSDLMPRFITEDMFVFTSVEQGVSRFRTATLIE